MKHRLLVIFNTLLIRYWGVLLFLILSFAAHGYALKQYNREYFKLSQLFANLIEEREKILLSNKNLSMEIRGQNDPMWIELTLMKCLGMVPKKQTKVFFIPDHIQK